jgi:hypothetical protein
MTSISEFEKLNERKMYHRTIDDDMMINLENYYKLEDHDALLEVAKKAMIIGDDDDPG